MSPSKKRKLKEIRLRNNLNTFGVIRSSIKLSTDLISEENMLQLLRNYSPQLPYRRIRNKFKGKFTNIEYVLNYEGDDFCKNLVTCLIISKLS
jgi:hypothetical protein